MDKSQVKNILIYRIGSIGDTCIAIPALQSIKTYFPNSNIAILTNLPAQNSKKTISLFLADK